MNDREAVIDDLRCSGASEETVLRSSQEEDLENAHRWRHQDSGLFSQVSNILETLGFSLRPKKPSERSLNQYHLT